MRHFHHFRVVLYSLNPHLFQIFKTFLVVDQTGPAHGCYMCLRCVNLNINRILYSNDFKRQRQIMRYTKEQQSVHQPTGSQRSLCCFVLCCKETGKSWENHPVRFVACNVEGQSGFKCQLFKFPTYWGWNWNLLHQSSQRTLQSALDCCF